MASKKQAVVVRDAKQKAPAPGKRVYVSAETIPRKTLEDAIVVAEKLHQIYAGKSASRHELATALGSAPNSPKTNYLLRSGCCLRHRQ